MTVKKTMRILLAGVLLCTLLSGCEKRSETPKETFSFDNLELTEYVPDAAIQDARLRLQNDTGKCTVLTGVEAQQRKVSLVFLGMADPAQVEQICDTLEEYNAEAVFVIDGLSAAEDVDSVRLISRKGNITYEFTSSKICKVSDSYFDVSCSAICKIRLNLGYSFNSIF